MVENNLLSDEELEKLCAGTWTQEAKDYLLKNQTELTKQVNKMGYKKYLELKNLYCEKANSEDEYGLDVLKTLLIENNFDVEKFVD